MKTNYPVWKIACLAFFALVANVISINAQSTEKSAGEILKEVSEQAARENKNVFVIFHASWCVWCHRMDSLMNAPDCKKLFADNYVVTHLTVMESATKKNLENPGAMELLAKYNGDKQGIPFWLILDKNGKLLADAQDRPAGVAIDKPGKNTGCPATPVEVAHFIKVLRKTSALNTNQLSVIERSFTKQ